MFNTAILDVAIGLIFIYLLLSLMCTAANEIIELLLKKRAVDLELGIRELLDPGSKPGDTKIVQKFYDHPLINGLFEGNYAKSGIKTKRHWVKRTQLPSYIPARNFALALMDLIRPGVAAVGIAERSGAADATAPSPAQPGSGPPGVVVNVPGGGAPLVVTPAPPVPNPSVEALRKALAESTDITEQIKKAVIPLLDAGGNDVSKVRENIEAWYNASMDRVSSWYKRRAQVTTLIIGLFIAVTVNVDTVTIAKRLSTDKALRESLVAASDAYAKAHAAASPTPKASPGVPAVATVAGASRTRSFTPSRGANQSEVTPVASTAPSPEQETSPPAEASPSTAPAGSLSTEPADSPSPAPAVSPSVVPVASPTPPSSTAAVPTETIPACVKDATSPECKRVKELQQACVEPESPKCRYLTNLNQIQALSLPIGWDTIDDPKRTWPGWHWKRDGGWWDQIYWHALGWILTALALSLGAPFWFDLLNKFIVIRSAVKPHEKSPEEGSKD